MSNFDLNSEAVENTDYILHNSTELEVLNNNKLSKVLEFLPSGIIDKKATGIGATYLEINSDRHSIIVVPTRALAATKVKSNKGTIYVGSEFDGLTGAFPAEIRAKHLANIKQDKFSKIIVVADSLPKVIEGIGENVYKDFFLMIDEIDSFQMNSIFRPKLETSIDYFLKFDKGCLVSATLKEFSNPDLEKYPKFTIKSKLKTDKIILTKTTNVLNTTKIYINAFIEALNAPDKKHQIDDYVLLVAYNSVTDIVKILSILDDKIKPFCSILCSPHSKPKCEIGDTNYFGVLKDKKVPNKINFITSSYFVGIDVENSSHIILVTNTIINYSLLNVESIQQIIGRSRVRTGRIGLIASADDIEGEIIPFKDLLNAANKQLAAIKCVENHFNPDPHLRSSIEDIRKGIVKNSRGGINCDLTRKNIAGQNLISYFNLDAFYSEQETTFLLYKDFNALKTALEDKDFEIETEVRNDKFTKEEREILAIAEEKLSVNRRVLIEEAINKLEDETIDRTDLIGAQNETAEYYDNLTKYLKKEDAISLLKENLAEKSDSRVINKILTACDIHFFDKSSSLKQMMNQEFKIGVHYTKDEIKEKMGKIFTTSLDASLNVPFTSEDQKVVIFNSIFKTNRTKNRIDGSSVNVYKILGDNPFGFVHKDAIVEEL